MPTPSTATPSTTRRPKAVAREEFAGRPRWQKVLLGIAVVFMLVGLGLSLTEKDEPASGMSGVQSTGSGGTLQPNGLSGGSIFDGSSGGSGGAQSGSDNLSPFFIKGGFSLFVGFCIGFALRTFFKISAVALGLVFLALFGLSYAGIIEVDWNMFEGWYDKLAGRVKDQAQSFQAFMAGSLPSAGLGGLGLFTGFKRG